MILLVALAALIFVSEIVLFAFLFSRLLEQLHASHAIRIVLVSVPAVLLAWLLPVEGWLGAGLNTAPFAPWGPFPITLAWFAAGIPAAAFFVKRPVE